jgi:hypothetical protein
MSKPELAPVRVIRAMLGFTRLTNQEFLVRLICIRDGMKGNSNFLDPPIDLGKFEEAVQAFSNAVTVALDGGKTAIAERNIRRQLVTSMAQQLGLYVSHNCKGEMDKFLSSGFEPMSTTRTPAGALTQPKIRKVKHGKSGELLVYPSPVKGAYSYEFGHALTDENRVPGEWFIRPLSSARAAVSIDGLTPGKVYAFKIRALGKVLYTDWSDPFFFMCT